MVHESLVSFCSIENMSVEGHFWTSELKFGVWYDSF